MWVAGDVAMIVQQAQADQPGDGGLRILAAQGGARRDDGRLRRRHTFLEQGRGREKAGFSLGQGRLVGGEGQPVEEQHHGVGAVLRRSVVDERLDLGRRRAGLEIGLDLLQGLGGDLQLPGQDRSDQHLLQARIAAGGGQGPRRQRPGRVVQPLLPGDPAGGLQLLLPLARGHGLQGDPGERLGQVAAMAVRQGEVIAAGDQQARGHPRSREGFQHRAQRLAIGRLHPGRSAVGLRRLQDPFQVVDDQQDRIGRERPREQALHRVRQLSLVIVDPGAPAVLVRLAFLRLHEIHQDVEDRHSIVAAEDHARGPQQTRAHPLGQAGLAERAHAVDQHPGGRRLPEGAQHLLDLTPAAHEGRPRGHRHLLAGLVEEDLRGGVLGMDTPGSCRRAQRPAAPGSQIDPRQMPVPAALPRLGPAQQRAAAQRRRPGHRRTLMAQGLVEHRGEVGGVVVIDRAVPAHHIGDLGGQLAHERGLAPLARLGRPAGRHHHQPWRRGAQGRQQIARLRMGRSAGFVLQHQDRPKRSIQVAMAGDVQGLERAFVAGHPQAQRRQRPGFLDHQMHPMGAPGGLQERRFLALVVQHRRHILRRGRQEHQLDVFVARRQHIPGRPDPTPHLEELQIVLRQGASRVGQDLPRGVKQPRLAWIGRVAIDPDLQLAVPRRPGPASRPARLVKPGEHLMTDIGDQAAADIRLGPLALQGHVIARRPVRQPRQRFVPAQLRLVGAQPADHLLAAKRDNPQWHSNPQRQCEERSTFASKPQCIVVPWTCST